MTGLPCFCGHSELNHEVRERITSPWNTICWECATFPNEPSTEITYHKFRVSNLDYLYEKYEENKRLDK